MPRAPALRLLLAACQYPALLLDDDLKGSVGTPGPAYRTLRRMAAHARVLPPAAVVWAGDRIYVDATAGLFDPAVDTGDDVAQLEHAMYRAYRDAARRPGWADLANHRHVHTIDDHEIVDNWEPSQHRQRDAVLRAMGAAGRAKFLSERRPDLGDDRLATEPLWSEEILAGGFGIFATDIRTERSMREAARIHDARLMRREQRSRFDAWLRERPGLNRLVVTPGMLLPRHRTIVEAERPDPRAPHRHGLARATAGQRAAAALRSDAWDGYPGALSALLALLADHQVQDCLFLSGDEHIGCFADITVQALDGDHKGPVRLASLHTGATYAPYPFANGEAADFTAQEEFEFDGPPGAKARRYRCCLSATFASDAGDGFTELRIDEQGRASATYYGERGTLQWAERAASTRNLSAPPPA